MTFCKMYVYKYFFLFLTVTKLLILEVLAQGEDCEFDDYINYDFRLQSGIFHTVSLSGIGPCIKECMLRTNCKSFNFYKPNGTCELSAVAKATVPEQLIAVNGYLQSDISVLPQSFAGKCSTVSCPARMKCINLASGNTVCMVTECPDPPIIPNAQASNERGVARSVVYSCATGYSLVGDATAQCKATGSWTTPKFECVRVCQMPPLVANAEYSYSSLLMGSTVTYTCNSGYRKSSTNTYITCQTDYTWSSVQFFCIVPIRNKSSGRVRLVGDPTTNGGRVEVYYNGQWGTVCDDSWEDVDALVVCRQLGYSSGIQLQSAFYGQGTGPIWMDEVGCTGSESTLLDCARSSWGVHNCVHTEDASVNCS